MGTEQKKDAGVMGLRTEPAHVAEAADSLPLSRCSSHSSHISMPGGSLRPLEPAGRKWGGITTFPSSSQPMHGSVASAPNLVPWAGQLWGECPWISELSPEQAFMMTCLSRRLLVTPSLHHFTFPISLSMYTYVYVYMYCGTHRGTYIHVVCVENIECVQCGWPYP